jgi:hypothetical protein
MTSASHTTSEPEVTIVTCAVATADLATSRGTTEGATFPKIKEKSFKISSHNHVFLVIKYLSKLFFDPRKNSSKIEKGTLLKLRYCEKATKLKKKLSLFLTFMSKQVGDFFQIFVAFPDNLNFKRGCR